MSYLARINTFILITSIVTVAISLIWIILILDDILQYWQNCKSLKLLSVTDSSAIARLHIIIIFITDQLIISQHITAVHHNLFLLTLFPSLVCDVYEVILFMTRNHQDLAGGDVCPVDTV